MTEYARIIGHRGIARHYPENTLASLEAAAAAGMDGVELDVQLSADGIPVVLHDAELERTTGLCGSAASLSASELMAISAHEPGRLGTRFKGESIPSLATACEQLARYPNLTVFIEIKPEIARFHAPPEAVRAIVDASALLGDRRVIISFRDDMLLLARSQGAARIGWVLPHFDVAAIERARALLPEFLFCDVTRLPEESAPLPRGPWEWAVYEVVEPDVGLHLWERGARWLESMDPVALRDGLDPLAGKD